MEVRDSIEKRRSIRKFKDTPVDLDLVSQLIEAAVAAPSAKNRQPWKFIVYTDAAKEEICDSLSIGAAIQNLLLEATAHGLGTLWIANTCFAYPELVKCIGTEDQLISVVSVGYAAENPDMRPRRKMEEVLEYRGFGCVQEEGVKTK